MKQDLRPPNEIKEVDITVPQGGTAFGAKIMVGGQEITNIRRLSVDIDVDRVNTLMIETLALDSISIHGGMIVDEKSFCPHCGQQVKKEETDQTVTLMDGSKVQL